MDSPNFTFRSQSPIYRDSTRGGAKVTKKRTSRTAFATTTATERRAARRMQKKGESSEVSVKFRKFQFKISSISSTTDSRMSTPGIQTTSHTPPTYFLDRTSSMSTLPDGLNHALNQENIRLQQIVYEHKVSDEFFDF